MVVVLFAAGCLEIISILFRLVSVSFRLYGNVFAGENMLETMARLIPGFSWLLPIPFYFVELLAVGEGLMEVTGDHVALLTDIAIPAEQIDKAKVEEARQRAAARLSEKLSDEEVASVNSGLARSLAQLPVKRRHRQ